MMNSQEQEFFSQLVYTYSGIALGADKTYLFENRLSEVAKAIGCPSLSDLYRRAKFNMTTDLRDRIVEAMTTNETLFFRDSAPFEALRTKIIPDIMKIPSIFICKELHKWRVYVFGTVYYKICVDPHTNSESPFTNSQMSYVVCFMRFFGRLIKV